MLAYLDYVEAVIKHPFVAPQTPALGFARLNTPAELHGFFADAMGSAIPGEADARFIWARNAAFDFTRLENMFAAAGLRLPWHRRAQCDLYTVQNMHTARTGVGPSQAIERTDSHTALGDCQHQLKELASLLE